MSGVRRVRASSACVHGLHVCVRGVGCAWRSSALARPRALRRLAHALALARGYRISKRFSSLRTTSSSTSVFLMKQRIFEGARRADGTGCQNDNLTLLFTSVVARITLGTLTTNFRYLVISSKPFFGRLEEEDRRFKKVSL